MQQSGATSHDQSEVVTILYLFETRKTFNPIFFISTHTVWAILKNHFQR